jgi:diacylglycerol kinase family enzyme
MHALLILNEKAGTLAANQEAQPQAIARALAKSGITVITQLPLQEMCGDGFKRHLTPRPDAVIVGGGDGTIAAAAGQLADTGIPLGILPLGTLNHFAKDLGLAEDWREVVPAIAAGPARPVDVGEVNGRVFINNCSLGLYAAAIRRRDALRQRHGFGKWWAMSLASLTVLRRLRRMRLKIATPEAAIRLRTPLVVVANNRYTGHLLATSLRARLDEGQLWVHTTRIGARFTMLRLVGQAMRRRLGEVDHLEARAVTNVTITSERGAVPIATDGELVDLDPPLRFRIRPRALHVLAPARTPK